MAQPYLDQLTALIRETIHSGKAGTSVECRHFFSGAAAYADGKVFAMVTPLGLALKLPPVDCQTLMELHGATPLRQFPEGPVKKDYVVLPPAMRRDPAALRPWLNASVASVRSQLPPAAGTSVA